MGQVACSSLAGSARRRCETDQPIGKARVMDDNNGNICQHSEEYENMATGTAANNEQRETIVHRNPAQQDVTSGIDTHVKNLDRMKKELANVTRPLDFMKRTSDLSAESLREIRTMKAEPNCSEAMRAIERREEIHTDIITAYVSVEHKYSEALEVCGARNHLDALLLEICVFFVSTNRLLTETCNDFKAGLNQAQTALHQYAERETFLISEVDSHCRELQSSRERQKAIAKRAGEQEDKLSKQLDQARKETCRISTELKDGRAEIERAKEINKDYQRLKTEHGKLHRAETEVGSLKKQLKDANVKSLQKRNQELQTLLQEATAELKNLKDLPTDEPDTQDDSADADHASVTSRKSFSEAAVGLLRKVRRTLDQLCTKVNDLKETRGGNGWGIVERTAGMVTETKTDMTMDIDDCLRLRKLQNGRIEALND